jgi:RimJ/RimL family protein N-acetyltransferase
MRMKLAVRQMRPDEVAIRIDYFHAAPKTYLEMLGVDPAKLPSKDDWLRQYELDAARPIEERLNVFLLWLGDNQPIGFSSADHIEFGRQANMHLHILDAGNRRSGIGTECVRLSAALYFDLLKLKRLYCQPNALNVAPNRTLQRAGFRYLETVMATPSPINFHQPVTRWVLERSERRE